MKSFSDKVVWITGASSGIGKELAIQLANQNAKVILSARNTEQLESVKASLKSPEKHLVLPLDLSNQENFHELTQNVLNHYGKIDYLFNSGGVSQRSQASETSLDVDRKIMEINFI
jgi:short-subunit dehydrogenase